MTYLQLEMERYDIYLQGEKIRSDIDENYICCTLVRRR